MSGRPHRYPRSAVAGDYLRAAGGLAVTALPLLAVEPHPLVAAVLLAGAVLFLVLLGRAALRQATAVEVDDTGIVAQGPLGGAIRWDELARVRLAYYSTRRDRRHGWMHLVLTGGGRTLRIESTIERFDDIAARVAEAARRRGLKLGRTTVENFAALGIDGEPR